MNDHPASDRTASILRREGGQVLPFTALALVLLIGLAGLVVDIGRVWVAQRQLQTAVDASAAAAGQGMPDSLAAYTAAVSYGGTGKNALSGYGVTANVPAVTFKCPPSPTGLPNCVLDTSGTAVPWQPPGALPSQNCGQAAPIMCNAVTVTETATVSTTFAHLFLPSFTVSASATAAARGGVPHPLNVEVILDSTRSMTSNCTGSVQGISGTPEKIDCAKEGVRALLQALVPCSPSLTSCRTAIANTGGEQGAYVPAQLDAVGLMTFPALSNATSRPLEINCVDDNFAVTYPTYPSGGSSQPFYSVVGLSSDYRPSATNTTLNGGIGGSDLVNALWWKQCPGASGTYSGGTSTNTITTGTRYYGVNSSGAGSTTATANPIMTRANESDDSFTFTLNGTPGNNTYTATVMSPAGTPTALSCSIEAGTSATSCSSPGPVPVGSQTLNVRVTRVGSSGTARRGSWTLHWSQPGGTYPGGDFYGLQVVGGQGSYLAGAITEAQRRLDAAKVSRPGVTSAIIVLSDGELNKPGTFTDTTPCNSANTAANAAKADQILIFSIAYDSSGNCSDASPGRYNNVAGLQLMKDIATSTFTFYNQPNPGDLTSVFQQVGESLTGSRLIG